MAKFKVGQRVIYRSVIGKATAHTTHTFIRGGPFRIASAPGVDMWKIGGVAGVVHPDALEDAVSAGLVSCGQLHTERKSITEMEAKLAKAEEGVRSRMKFIAKLSHELELPKVSHSEEKDYVEAIRALRSEVSELKHQWEHRPVACLGKDSCGPVAKGEIELGHSQRLVAALEAKIKETVEQLTNSNDLMCVVIHDLKSASEKDT